MTSLIVSKLFIYIHLNHGGKKHLQTIKNAYEYCFCGIFNIVVKSVIFLNEVGPTFTRMSSV